LLALLLACGLRRHELAKLTLSHLQQREGHRAIVDLRGKAGHVRTVPVPDWVHGLLVDWTTAADIKIGSLFRRVSSAGKVWGEAVTEKLVWHIVKQFAAKSGVSSRRMISNEAALASAVPPAASWSRFSFCWATSRCKRPNATSAAHNALLSRSTTRSESNQATRASPPLEEWPTIPLELVTK
jgi:hypothetical protein